MARHEGFTRCYYVGFDPLLFSSSMEPPDKWAGTWNKVWYTVWSDEEERTIFEHTFHDVSRESLDRLFWLMKACPRKTITPTIWMFWTDQHIAVTDKQRENHAIQLGKM